MHCLFLLSPHPVSRSQYGISGKTQFCFEKFGLSLYSREKKKQKREKWKKEKKQKGKVEERQKAEYIFYSCGASASDVEYIKYVTLPLEENQAQAYILTLFYHNVA